MFSLVTRISSRRFGAAAGSASFSSRRFSASTAASVAFQHHHGAVTTRSAQAPLSQRFTAAQRSNYQCRFTDNERNPARWCSSSATRPLAAASKDVDGELPSIFSRDVSDFASLGIQSPVLLERLQQIGLERPTVVQEKAYRDIELGSNNVTVGAETGSGKTLAYLLPLMDDILQRKASSSKEKPGYEFARAVILVPNKELVQQLVRMALPLAGGPRALIYGGSALVDPSILLGDDDDDDDERNNAADQNDQTIVRLAILPGGLKEPTDFPPFRQMASGNAPPVDLLVTTPASLGPMALKPQNIGMFADIATLIIDEADMLLDGGYIKALEQVLLGFRRSDKLTNRMGLPKTQHVFVAATLPDFGLRSVDAYLRKKFPTSKRVTVSGMHKARHSGLAASTVWVQEESKKARMEHLVQLLAEEASSDDGKNGLKGEKVMVFLNSVQDVEGACDALRRAGFNAVAYHAKMPLLERNKVLDRFRRYQKGKDGDEDDTVPILVCTDLASRGLDVPGVTAVVQLQFAGNVVAHLHRMGRSGRAGQREGRGFVFYSEQESALVEVVRDAEQEQHSSLTLQGPDVMEIEFKEEDVATDEAGNLQKSTEYRKPREAGAVNKAFSRRRGFTRKRKQIQRKAEEAEVSEEHQLNNTEV